MSNQNCVALPSEGPFGWGQAGAEITKGLIGHGWQGSSLPDGYVGVKGLNVPLVQAISGPDWGMTHRAVGVPNWGYGFIENDIAASSLMPLASRLWDGVICGSNWMADWVTRATKSVSSWVPEITTATQGVNPEVFNFRPFGRTSKDSFIIGSFGKFEYRKAQDVVIKALSLFSQRHKDAILCHNWFNPWPSLAVDAMGNSDWSFQFETHQNPRYNIWPEVLSNIRIKISNLKIREMPFGFSGDSQEEIAKEMAMCDVILFPNRCEAGTNLMLHQALAIGVPCIVANATGQADLVEHADYPCRDLALNGGEDYVYSRNGADLGNWHRVCMDDVLDKLERVYLERDKWAAKREEISKFGTSFTWEKTAARINSIVESY